MRFIRIQNGFSCTAMTTLLTLNAVFHAEAETPRPPFAAMPAAGLRRSSGRLRGIELKHPVTGHHAAAGIGFSLPVLLLGPLPFVMRGDAGLVLRVLLLCLLLPLVGQVWAARQANRWHVQRLLARGYRVLRTAPGVVSAAEWRLGMSLPRY